MDTVDLTPPIDWKNEIVDKLRKATSIALRRFFDSDKTDTDALDEAYELHLQACRLCPLE